MMALQEAILTKFVSGQVSCGSHEQLLTQALYLSDLACNVDFHKRHVSRVPQATFVYLHPT